MSKLLRYYSPGNAYFVTAVTYRREAILLEHVDLFWRALQSVRRNANFEPIAWVVLPDHFHMVINPGGENLSSLMQRIKMSFATNYRKRRGIYRGRVWQNRFWDHVIRDDDDMNRHIDYIHYNPVKHGFVVSPFDWEQSSIRDYHKRGLYELDWGQAESLVFEGGFGE